MSRLCYFVAPVCVWLMVIHHGPTPRRRLASFADRLKQARESAHKRPLNRHEEWRARMQEPRCATEPPPTEEKTPPLRDPVAARPDILLMIADDLSREGLRDARTPSLDALAARGVSLENVRIMGSRVGAVCAPARAMLLTGRSLWRAYKQPEGTDAYARPALGESLRGAGYATASIGKWHGALTTWRQNFERGRSVLFANYPAGQMLLDTKSSERRLPMRDAEAHHRLPFGSSGAAFGVAASALSACELARAPISAGRSRFANWRACHSSEVFADSAVALMTESCGRKPLFLYVAFTAPHDPFSAPTTEHLADTPEPSLPETFRRWHKFELESVQGFKNSDLAFEDRERVPLDSNEPLGWTMIGVRDEERMSHPRTNASVREELRHYHAMIEHLDACVARVLAATAEPTLVIFTSDHGLANGAHGLLGKQSLYEHSGGVPLIIAGAGVRIRTDALRRAPLFAFDLAPTVHALVGLAVPRGMTGLDFSPILLPAANASSWRPRRYMLGAMFRHRMLYDTDTGLKLHVSFGRQGRSVAALQLFALGDWTARSLDRLERRDLLGEAHRTPGDYRSAAELVARSVKDPEAGGARILHGALREWYPALKVMLLRLCQLESEYAGGELAAWDLAVRWCGPMNREPSSLEQHEAERALAIQLARIHS